MNEIKNISKALVEFHKEVNCRVAFDSNNPYYNSKYASLGAVIDHISKTAPSFGLSWLQLPTYEPVSHLVGVRTIVLHESGESIESTINMPINTSLTKMDNKTGEIYTTDIETPRIAQEVGSVITYLRRYGLAAAFGLYADEDTDANPSEPPQKLQPVRKPVKKVEAKQKPARPYESDVLIANLKKMAGKSEPCTQKDRQTLVAAIIQLLGTVDPDIRHEMQHVLFGARSIAEVEPEMVSAALAWLSPVWDKEAKVYLFGEYAVDEFNKVREDYAI